MSDYLASIRTDRGETTAVDPSGFRIRHHLTGAARVEMERPTGGHLLHAAVGMCLFNGIVGLAAERSIRLDDVRVEVRGGFAGDEMASTGVTYDIAVDSPAGDEEVRALVAEVTGDSPVSRSIERGTEVRIGSVTVNAAATGR